MPQPVLDSPTAVVNDAPSIEELEQFLHHAEARLNDLSIKINRASWIHQTYINDDTQAMVAAAYETALAVVFELVARARKFDGMPMPEQFARKLQLLRLLPSVPTPSSAKERMELV